VELPEQTLRLINSLAIFFVSDDHLQFGPRLVHRFFQAVG
jgi:hypothetical protein